MAEVSTAQGNSLVGQDAPTNSSWTTGDGNMLDDATETDTLSFLAPVQHSDRDDFLINIHVEEAGSASPLDALKRSKSGARVNLPPLSAASVQPEHNIGSPVLRRWESGDNIVARHVAWHGLPSRRCLRVSRHPRCTIFTLLCLGDKPHCGPTFFNACLDTRPPLPWLLQSGRSSPMRGRSVSPLRERLIAKALTANTEVKCTGPPPKAQSLGQAQEGVDISSQTRGIPHCMIRLLCRELS